MPKRHHIVTMSLLGLCLGTGAACGSEDWTARVGVPAGPARNSSPTQSAESTVGPGSTSPGHTSSGSASPTPGQSTGAAPVPKGFKSIGGPANGFSVAVPKEWVAIDLTKDGLEKGLKDSGLSGPILEQAKKSLQPLVDNKGIWAANPESAKTSPNGFPTNLNGFCQAGRQTSAEQLIKETRAQLEQLKAKVIAAGKVRIGSREAARIVYTFPTNGVDVRGTQYYVPTENKTCIVTLSTDVDGRQELFDRIGQTIRPA